MKSTRSRDAKRLRGGIECVVEKRSSQKGGGHESTFHPRLVSHSAVPLSLDRISGHSLRTLAGALTAADRSVCGVLRNA